MWVLRRWCRRHSAASCRRRRTGLWSAFGLGVVVVGVDVVDVASACGPGAPGEHAGAISEDDLFADPVGTRTPGSKLGVEVDDGPDGDLGAGVAAPGLELVEQEEPWPSSSRPVGPNTVSVAPDGWRRSGREGRPRERSAAPSLARAAPAARRRGGRGRSGCEPGRRGPWPVGRPTTRWSRGPSVPRPRGRGPGRGRVRRRGRARPRMHRAGEVDVLAVQLAWRGSTWR